MQQITHLLAATTLLICSTSYATVYQYEDLNASNGGIADQLDTVTSSYDDVSNLFTWDTTFNTDPTDVDGFWLVVNNGANPKDSNVNELAILYGDMATGTLTTYVYNGFNNANSWDNPGIYLQTDAFTVTDDAISLSIDTTLINAWSADPDYTGVAFDENIGIWFHISTGSSFAYDGLELDGYSYANQGWYDLADQAATASVPEPSSIALLGLGLLGFGFSRRR